MSPWYSQVKGHEAKYQKDYVELYINHIRKHLLQEDTTRPFAPSSPSNGLETEKENWTAKHPQDTRYGDVHYYNDGGKLWDWKTFPSAKFASEYGFQSYPSLETLSQVIKESELTYPISKAIDHHQHHGRGGGSIEKQICVYLIFIENFDINCKINTKVLQFRFSFHSSAKSYLIYYY
jgi:beta-mannosidase